MEASEELEVQKLMEQMHLSFSANVGVQNVGTFSENVGNDSDESQKGGNELCGALEDDTISVDSGQDEQTGQGLVRFVIHFEIIIILLLIHVIIIIFTIAIIINITNKIGYCTQL